MELRKLLAIGTGVGIEIGTQDLEVTMACVRPSGVEVVAATTICGFRERPAAEWGTEYARFLKQHGGSHLTATILLPRRETIVRQIVLPGVSTKDVAAAIRFQVDTLHPYGEDEAAYAWTLLGKAAVLIGIVRRATLERYAALFTEAGVAVASMTFSAAVIRAALRLYASPPGEGFLAVHSAVDGQLELYGESPARPLFSAEFEVEADRAAALAAAELRLSGEPEPRPLADLLPRPRAIPQDYDLSRNALPYASALAGACPRLAPAANLLPVEHRSSSSRAMFLPTAILAALLLFVVGAMAGYSSYADRRYLSRLEREIARLEPLSKQAEALDRSIQGQQARIHVLDEFRQRSKLDLDALNELTQILAPPVWTNLVELTRDAVVIGGEADQAAPLLKIIDASPYFQNSAFEIALARTQTGEIFRIRAQREVPAAPGKNSAPAAPSAPAVKPVFTPGARR